MGVALAAGRAGLFMAGKLAPHFSTVIDRASTIMKLPWICGLGLSIGFSLLGRAEELPSHSRIPNPLFAMNFTTGDSQLASSYEEQAKLLKAAGYAGCQYLGPLDRLSQAQEAMGGQGLEVFTVAVIPYNVPVDPGAGYPSVLKDAIRQLEGQKPLVLFQFTSKTYPRSSPEGDARAVELGRELADYARSYGVRLVLYHHVGVWCERADDVTRIVNKCDRENLGSCINLFHWMRTDPEGDLDALVREAMPHLFLLTINGTSADGSYLTLDQGPEHSYRFLKPFLSAGYEGPIGLQCVGIRGDARVNLERSMEAWRAMSSSLKKQLPPGGRRHRGG